MPIPEVLLAYAAYKLMKETIGTPSDWIANAKENKKAEAANAVEKADSAEKTATIADLEAILQNDVETKNTQQSDESKLETENFGIAGMIK